MTGSTSPLAGKVALLTGASSRIGEATALAFAEAGASIAISARCRSDRAHDHITYAGAKNTSQENCDSMDSRQADDLAAAIIYAATRPDRVAVNEILIRPTDHVQP